MNKIFYTDDKFEEIIVALERLGWKREVNSEEKYQVNLLWVNLKQIEFANVDSLVLVNHLQGSQHFSNKVP